MALYDYKCPDCKQIHTVEHSVNETPLIECEACNLIMNKVFSAPTVTFKGGGWGHL